MAPCTAAQLQQRNFRTTEETHHYVQRATNLNDLHFTWYIYQAGNCSEGTFGVYPESKLTRGLGVAI
jgi:hypothetical protein